MFKKSKQLKHAVFVVMVSCLVFSFYAGLFLTSSRAFRMVQDMSNTFDKAVFYLLASRLGELGDDVGGMAGSLDTAAVEHALQHYRKLTGLVWLQRDDGNGLAIQAAWAHWQAGSLGRPELVRAFVEAGETLQQIHDGLNTAFSLSFLFFGLLFSLTAAGSVAFYANLQRSKLEEKLTRDMFRLNLQAEENTRKAVAMELHDDLAQDIAAARMLCERSYSSYGGDMVSKAVCILGVANSKLHSLSAELRPPELDVLGVGSALKALCRDFEQKTGFELIFEGRENLPRLPEEIELNLYRIMREAVANAIKFADSGKATLNCRLTRQSYGDQSAMVILMLSLHDAGFATKVKLAAANRFYPSVYGLGIKTMQERAATIGARLDIDIKPEGSVVCLMLDLQPYVDQAQIA